MLKYSPPKMIDSIRKWDLLEVIRSWEWTQWMGLSLLLKSWERLLVPSAMWGHRKKALSMNRKWALARHQFCWCHGLGLPASKAMKNKFLLFTTHRVFGILLWQHSHATACKVPENYTIVEVSCWDLKRRLTKPHCLTSTSPQCSP
jgi:hypothetical protein